MQPDPTVNILLVDDHPENLLTLEAVLGGLGENLVKANSGEEALRCLLNQDFAVILLDVQMPEMDGFETATLIRNRPRSRETPIIFLTAFSTNEQLMFKGYSLGAVDYLLKPIDPVILTSKVTVFVELFKKTTTLKQQTAKLEAINAELRQSEERFRSLSASSPVGIFVTDTEGHWIYTNPRFQTICNLTVQDSLTAGWLNSVHPEDQERVLPAWSAYMHEGWEYSDEFRIQVRGGNVRWVHVRSSPMLSDQGASLGHVGTLEDITDRKQAEAVRAQMIREQAARQEAEAANRMKDEFLAVLSHELRTPLNSMLGWARLLRTKKFDENTTARALETIERNAIAQAQLIEDILDVSKIIRGKLRMSCGPVNLIAVIEAALDAVRPQAEAKSIRLIANLDTTIQYIWGDPVRLQQVVWNLLTNAIKFTADEGTVEARLTAICQGDGDAETPTQDAAIATDKAPSAMPIVPPYAQIEVIDTGIGISPDFLPKVFDRFRQADSTTTRSHNGLGLGLAIVRHLVELHGGTVQAESAGLDQGATFRVCIPITRTVAGQSGKQDQVTDPTKPEHAKPDPVEEVLEETSAHVSPLVAPMLLATQPPQPECPEISLQGLRILAVDDEADSRNVLAVMLQQYGATVRAVGSASEALETLDGFKPDVLVSDISMPIEDGYTLLRKVRELEPEPTACIPAIALTAYSREEDRQQVLSAGFQAHVPKPVEANQLIGAIAQALNGALKQA